MNCTHTHTTRLVHPDDLGTPGYVTNVRPAAAVTQEKPKIKKKYIFGYQIQISGDTGIILSLFGLKSKRVQFCMNLPMDQHVIFITSS